MNDQLKEVLKQLYWLFVIGYILIALIYYLTT